MSDQGRWAFEFSRSTATSVPGLRPANDRPGAREPTAERRRHLKNKLQMHVQLPTERDQLCRTYGRFDRYQ
jgi:hypothetical protein